MKITVASLTLRFYHCDGWSKDLVKKLLVDQTMEITERLDVLFPELKYYACYDNNGSRVFSKLIYQHEFDDHQNFGFSYYIEE
jgi:hypothetical protein